jgi:hypothetical protein
MEMESFVICRDDESERVAIAQSGWRVWRLALVET